MRAHLFKNVFELSHVKTSLRELNKNRDSYVIANLSNNKRRGTIKSPWPIKKVFLSPVTAQKYGMLHLY